MATATERDCAECGAEFTARHPTARYCSARCRTRASRGGRTRGRGAPVVPLKKPQPAAVEVGSVLEATRRVLDDAGRADTPMGRAALALAQRIDTRQDTGAGMTTAVRGLDEALRAAMEGVSSGGTLVDLKARRDARRNA